MRRFRSCFRRTQTRAGWQRIVQQATLLGVSLQRVTSTISHEGLFSIRRQVLKLMHGLGVTAVLYLWCSLDHLHLALQRWKADLIVLCLSIVTFFDCWTLCNCWTSRSKTSMSVSRWSWRWVRYRENCRMEEFSSLAGERRRSYLLEHLGISNRRHEGV